MLVQTHRYFLSFLPSAVDFRQWLDFCALRVRTAPCLRAFHTRFSVVGGMRQRWQDFVVADPGSAFTSDVRDVCGRLFLARVCVVSSLSVRLSVSNTTLFAADDANYACPCRDIVAASSRLGVFRLHIPDSLQDPVTQLALIDSLQNDIGDCIYSARGHVVCFGPVRVFARCTQQSTQPPIPPG